MGKYSDLPKVENLNIFLATPVAKDAMLHAETAKFCAVMNQYPNIQWGYATGLTPECSRNTLLEYHFHKDPCWTHVLFLDADVAPPLNALKLLLQLEADVAVGPTPIKANGVLVWNINIKEESPWLGMEEGLPDEPFEVYSSGAGCVLVRREVLVDIGWPWFKTEYQEIFKNEGRSVAEGEDVFFIRRVKECGYKIIAHPGVQCRHFNRVDLLETFNSCKRCLLKSDDEEE